MNPEEIHESNNQFAEAWKFFAGAAQSGLIEERNGVVAALSQVELAFFNMVLLSRPVTDLSDFEHRIAAAAECGARCRFGWFLALCDDWIPASLREQASLRLAAAGLAPAMSLTGMVTAEILPAKRPAPAVEMRRVSDAATRCAVADLNCASYGIPLELGRGSIDRETIWSSSVFGYVGYAGAAAVATSTTIVIDGRLYVALVATPAEHQRKGYAEAVMRHALNEGARATGLRRTVLHATPAGRPVYERMGYRAVTGFTLYAGAGH